MQIIRDNEYLQPYENIIEERFRRFNQKKEELTRIFGSYEQLTSAYIDFGLHKVPHGIIYREWIPGVKQCSLCGDFNNWNPNDPACQAKKCSDNVFELFLPDTVTGPRIPHASKIRIRLINNDNRELWRIPAWITYVHQSNDTLKFDGIFWNPPEPFTPKYPNPNPKMSLSDSIETDPPLIYEAHIGMAGVEPRIHTYREFRLHMLPRIKKMGYNAVQLMGIMEHAYYASFGYQVTSFFAPSSRFGTPDELKALIDFAHSLGLRVFLDLVHSHASKNADDGLNFFNGYPDASDIPPESNFGNSGNQMYFCGTHPVWDSKLFNYGSPRVLQFLLSNIRYWMEEFRFDGFRFDGVTSILYSHHGTAHDYWDLNDFFDPSQNNEDAHVFLRLANELVHTLKKTAATIGEDVSGMPGLTRPLPEGGLGFDFRLAMGCPDLWQRYAQLREESWKISEIAKIIGERAKGESTISYCECHDQALVGSKTLAFWLMDKEMYTSMSVFSAENAVVDRGIALLKTIRLVTFGLGGEGYLNFMGNEFGHPEWIDFPREGNHGSFEHCRRRFDLADDTSLKYKFLASFDAAMLDLENQTYFLKKRGQNPNDGTKIVYQSEEDKLLVFWRGNMLWVFNFHGWNSYSDYMVGLPEPGKYTTILSTDDQDFGGYGRIDHMTEHFTSPEPMHGCSQRISLYIPSRCAFVLAISH